MKISNVLKVLIVDDHLEMRRTLISIITEMVEIDVEFIECGDGNEAIESFISFQPHWVLMDVQLKTTNGFDVARSIIESDSKAKIVFITSHNNPIFKEKAHALNTGFVSKDNLSELKHFFN